MAETAPDVSQRITLEVIAEREDGEWPARVAQRKRQHNDVVMGVVAIDNADALISAGWVVKPAANRALRLTDAGRAVLD